MHIHFRECDRKKMNKETFRKEISGAYIMGAMDFIHDFIQEYRNQSLTMDEVVGELEKIALEKYELSKKTHKLIKLPKFTVDNFAR
jgi:hypothetical protein